MRLNRIYQQTDITLNQELNIDKAASLHLSKVLRMKIGDALELFNGDGYRYQAVITNIERHRVKVSVTSKDQYHSESPLSIHLYQGVSRGDKMDLTIQKCVELGVKTFTPIITERCGVKLDTKRWAKKQEHWQKVIISACEQSGRDSIPTIYSVTRWQDAVLKLSTNSYFLDPHASHSFRDLTAPDNTTEIQLWVGPEGGFSEQEVRHIKNLHIQPVSLGPRILRTETAALAAVSAINAIWGDF